MDLAATSAIVSGGASGLGAATARALAARGAFVTILDLNDAAGAALATELEGAIHVVADVTDPDAVASAVASASEAGPLRVAVSCAGIGHGARTVDRDGAPADLDDFRRVITINLIGTYNLASRAAAAMARNEPLEHGERGVIINTASVAAFEGQIGQTAYSASKGGVVGMTLPMARDLSTFGIRVNTIAPGIIDTPLLGSLKEEYRVALAANVPFPKRLGTPDDYAQLALALIDNGYMNGETVRMDGALRMAPK
jgi:NAD(P)-dependent dehydrogenase (short-subunit alcohol dehydrogenase family)